MSAYATIIELWPYAADAKYDRRVRMLCDDATATARAGCSTEQIEAAFESIARRVSGFGTAMPLLHAALVDLRASEKRRKDPGAVTNTRREPEPAGPPTPWLADGMTFGRWVQRDRAKAEAAIKRAGFTPNQERGLLSLIERGRLLNADAALAMECAEEWARLDGIKPGGLGQSFAWSDLRNAVQKEHRPETLRAGDQTR